MERWGGCRQSGGDQVGSAVSHLNSKYTNPFPLSLFPPSLSLSLSLPSVIVIYDRVINSRGHYSPALEARSIGIVKILYLLVNNGERLVTPSHPAPCRPSVNPDAGPLMPGVSCSPERPLLANNRPACTLARSRERLQ